MAKSLGIHTPCTGTRVKEGSLPRLLNCLSPVVPSWWMFALQIGVPTVQTSLIQATNPQTNQTSLYSSLTQALEWWINNHDNPTYEVIISTLDPKLGETTLVMNRVLAGQVRALVAKEQAAVLMAEGIRPQKGNLAAAALWTNFTALYDALAQPRVATGLAVKLYNGAIITSETRDAIQTPGISSTERAFLLIQAVESSINIDHARLRKFTRVLRKQPLLEPVAKQLRQCYRTLVSEARLTESSSSGSDTDSTESQDSRTERRIAVLEEKYLALVQKAQMDVMKQKPDLVKFLTEITLLPTSFKEEHIKQYIKDNLPQLYDAKSIPEVFGLLNLGWNYLHYGLLQRIIKIYGADDTKELMKSYVDDVKTFQEETTLATFWRVGSKRTDDVPKLLKEKLAEALISHKELTLSSSLKSIEKLRQEFAQKLSLPEFAIVMKDVLPGSVIISWLMPPKGATTLMTQVKKGTIEFLKPHHVLELRMNDVIIYSSAAAKPPIPPAHLPSTTTELNLCARPSENEAKSAPPILPHISKPGEPPETSPKDTAAAKPPIPPAHLPSTTTELNLCARPSENEAKSAPPILPHISKPGEPPETSPKDTEINISRNGVPGDPSSKPTPQHETPSVSPTGAQTQPTSKSAATTEIEISDLDFGDQIREGGTGIVYKGHWKSQGLDVAIKTTGVLMKAEVEYLNSLDHPNIVSFCGAVIKKPNYYIVTEFAEHGSLHDYLQEVKFQVDYKQRLKWAMQIAKGMNYLHKMKIMHRDLKPHNVVITKDLTAKICDFGAAKNFEHTTKHTMTGTFRWIAPEVLNEKPYSLKCDVFSFGMILYELIACKEPFSDIPAMEAVAKIRNGEKPDIPDSCEPYLSTLLTICWEIDPKARPTFAKIISILDSKGFYELSKMFLQSLQMMIDSMAETSNATQRAKTALSSLTLQLHDEKFVPLVDSAVYQEARTIPELMKSMSPYWNCLSAGLLHTVVNSSGCSVSASALRDFKSARNSSSHLILVKRAAFTSSDQKALHSLNPKSVQSEELQSCQAAVFARLAGHRLCASVNVTQISVEVDKAILHLTDYDRITEAVVNFFRLPVDALVYCGCSENPLALFWEVSKELVAHISAAVPRNEHYRQLLQCSITTLVVRDKIKYTCPKMKDVELWEASSKGDTDKMLDLLKCVTVDVVDFAGWTALVEASDNGQSKAVEVLIKEGANVNHQIKDGRTPLYTASTGGHTHVAELLLNNGAKVNLQGEDGATPLFAASQEGKSSLVKLLLDRGADINLSRKDGNTPLIVASWKGHPKTVELLIRYGADINTLGKNQETAIMKAARGGHIRVVARLLHYRANTNTRNKKQQTALDIARSVGHTKVCEELRKYY